MQETTLMKLVVDASTEKVVGVHMVGDSAGEIIQLAGVSDCPPSPQRGHTPPNPSP